MGNREIATFQKRFNKYGLDLDQDSYTFAYLRNPNFDECAKAILCTSLQASEQERFKYFVELLKAKQNEKGDRKKMQKVMREILALKEKYNLLVEDEKDLRLSELDVLGW